MFYVSNFDDGIGVANNFDHMAPKLPLDSIIIFDRNCSIRCCCRVFAVIDL